MKTNSELKKSTIDFLNKNHDASLNNKNVRFSSINKSKNVWWFNIPMKKFNEEVNLFLFDENKTIWINLPKNFCLNLTDNFRIRVDNKKTILTLKFVQTNRIQIF